jgi:hypothetical protein
MRLDQACKTDGIDRDGDASLGDGWEWILQGWAIPIYPYSSLKPSLFIPTLSPLYPHFIPFFPNSNEILINLRWLWASI